MTDAETIWDVIIIGGGPAGLSAALWCCELGMRTLLLERAADIGGQLRNIFNPIENYPGVRVANGAEMLERFRDSVNARSFVRELRAEVNSLEPESRTIFLANGERRVGSSVIIATGVRRRRLGVPGEAEFRGRGIVESGVGEKEHLRGKRILIVGGGDAAIENALILSEVAISVKVAFRKEKPTARAELLSLIGDRQNVELLRATILESVTGHDMVSAVQLRDLASGDARDEPVDAVLVRIGVEPNTEFLRDGVGLDAHGYVIANAFTETDVPGIFAVGDVANPVAPTIAGAVGTGSTAAKSIRLRLSRQASNPVPEPAD